MPVRCATRLVLVVLIAFGLVVDSSAQKGAGGNADWAAYNGGLNGDHYARLTQITRANVQKLRQAWVYDTGEPGGIQTNPLVVDGVLYGYTPTQQVIALDAATGRLKWKFDSEIKGNQPARGLSLWSDGKEKRLFAGVMNFLYCLDLETGRPIASFGENGRIDLRKGLREPWEDQSIALTAPGVLYKDLIIVGGRNPETHPAPPGDIRAFDVHTGAVRWVFHTIPRPGETGYDTWPKDAYKTAGAANNWAGMTLDEKKGILFVPTGSAVMDFYGGDRVGDDLYANCLLALDAATGKLLWHFQGVHHDIWDRDFPSPPALFTMKKDGKAIEAVAQPTKQGWLYVFDRATGKPLFPVSEKAYPASTVPGELAAKTQPLPEWPKPYARQRLTEDMLTTRTPEAHAWAVEQFRDLQSGGQFVPFLSNGKETVVLPGFDGGAEWGGPAVDPVHNVIYINANEMAWLGGLAAVGKPNSAGEKIYSGQCAACHGVNRAGSPPDFPSLVDVTKRLSEERIAATVQGGKGRMPGFPDVTGQRLKDLMEFLRTPLPAEDKKEMQASGHERSAESGVPDYMFAGYKKFLDPEGYPAIAPPWGTLSAIDLNTGNYLWKINLGEFPELVAKGMKDTGSENYGGPILTETGVLFIGATDHDRKFRGFDASNGKLLWETVLPYLGNSTPATYMVDGKQYVVIGASGARDAKTPQGSAYVAFSLP